MDIKITFKFKFLKSSIYVFPQFVYKKRYLLDISDICMNPFLYMPVS